MPAAEFGTGRITRTQGLRVGVFVARVGATRAGVSVVEDMDPAAGYCVPGGDKNVASNSASGIGSVAASKCTHVKGNSVQCNGRFATSDGALDDGKGVGSNSALGNESLRKKEIQGLAWRYNQRQLSLGW